MIGKVTECVFMSIFDPSWCWAFRYFCPSFLINFLAYYSFHKLYPTFSVHSGIYSWYWVTLIDHLALLFTHISLTGSLCPPFLEIFSNLASNLLLIWKKTSAIRKHATKWKKPDTEGRILGDSFYMNCPAQANAQRRKAGQWLPGAEEQMRWLLPGHRVSSVGDENAVELDRGGGCTTF